LPSSSGATIPGRMRGVVLSLAVVAAVALVPVAVGERVDPHLSVFAGDPLGVRGTNFQPAERVTVRFAGGADLRADPPRWHYRIATSDETGTFAVRFKDFTLTRCTSYAVRARGSLGSAAFFERTVRCRRGASSRR
jgi:hypothetical protein